MLIFDVLEDQITLSTELKGNILSEYPDKYIYFIDYIDLRNLVRETGRFLRDQEPEDLIQPMDMVAASWAQHYGDYRAVFCAIVESPYAVVYFADKIVTKSRLQQLIETTISLSGRLIGGKK